MDPSDLILVRNTHETDEGDREARQRTDQR